MLKRTLLFYQKLLVNIQAQGFIMKLYDPCVANKIVASSQMTVIWHVNNLKVSHINPIENTKFAVWLSKTYSTITVKRCKVTDY